MEIRPIFSALMRNKAGLALIVLQVAITLAVVCNSLFIIIDRSQKMARPSGMDEANTFLIDSLGLAPGFDLRNSIREDLDLIASLPGVVAVSTANSVPMKQGGWDTGVDSQPLDETGTRESPSTALYFVNQNGRAAFGARLIEGRDFDADEIKDYTRETRVQADSIIITQALAEKLFPGQSAVGKQIYGITGEDDTVTVIGVIDRLQQPWTNNTSIEYSTLVPNHLMLENWVRYLIRAEPGQRDRLMKEVETRLQDSNPGRLVRRLESLESIRAKAYRQDRAMMTILFAVMGALILVTGCGIVGLASFWVTRRIKQIGTRRALGARRFNIRSYFQTENGVMVSLGVVLGALLTYGFNLWLMQHYNAARLPWFYLPIGALTVFVLGQIAVWGPASRAAAVAPAVATRSV